MSQRISILGCGWLGFPLAKSLVADGFYVKGSTTTLDRLELLSDAGIQPFLINLDVDLINGKIDSFLSESDVLIIAIPPKRKSPEVDSFHDKINRLIQHIEKSTVKKLLFISSTSVYGNAEGMINELTKPNPETESGKQLVEVENLLKQNKNFKYTILRFGGLVGVNRNPVKYLVDKANTDASAPINLIHQDDAIGVIQEIISQGVWEETLNAVAPFYPTRQEYYSQKAKELNLPKPIFTEEKTMAYKVISSEYLQKRLNYTFKIKV